MGPRVLFAGGGTGGHVYPAIAIANALKVINPKSAIAFAGTRERLEWTAVPKAGYPIYDISVSAFPRKLSMSLLSFPLKLVKGIRDSFELIKGFRPDVVVGTGGYVSGPVLWAANRKNIPTLIQEQNAFAGATNKILGKNAEKIFLAFQEAGAYFPENRWEVSGNPVRSAIVEKDREESRAHFGLDNSGKVLFLFGGSLGSQALNEAMKRIVPNLLQHEDLNIIWQTGRNNFDKVTEGLASSDRVKVLPYVDRMDYAYSAADLVLCRAGAITCSEIMMTAKPAILVPLPSAAEDHQTHNARAMVSAGAAHLVKQADLSTSLESTIIELINDGERLVQMGQAAKTIAKPDAAKLIAREVVELADNHSG